MAKHFRTLAIAAASGRVGFVLLRGKNLVDWGMSRKASQGPEELREVALKWIEKLTPDMIVTEMAYSSNHKGINTQKLLEAANKLADNQKCLNATVIRHQPYTNKYVEAAELVKQFPNLEPWQPKKPPVWMPEPRTTIYFEALAMALEARK